MSSLIIEPNVYYTVDEAAARLRVSPRTILRLLRTRVIKGIKIGRQWRILGASLLELPHAQSAPAPPQRSLLEVLEAIHARQRARGHVPPAPEEVTTYLQAERDGWGE